MGEGTRSNPRAPSGCLSVHFKQIYQNCVCAYRASKREARERERERDLKRQGTGRSRVSVNDFAILINKKFGKVPLDSRSKQARLASFQKFVKWCSIRTIYTHLQIQNLKNN